MKRDLPSVLNIYWRNRYTFEKIKKGAKASKSKKSEVDWGGGGIRGEDLIDGVAGVAIAWRYLAAEFKK